MKFMQNFICFTHLCINVLGMPSISCEYQPRHLNITTCSHVLRLTCRVHCLWFLERHNTSVFSVDFHSGLTKRNWKPMHCMCKALFWRCKQYQIVSKIQMVDLASSNSDTLVESVAVTVYPIHVHYEEEWWWHTTLSGFNTHGEQLWLNLPTWTQTSEQEYSDLMASNRWSSTPYSPNSSQNFSLGTQSYTLLRSTKHVEKSLADFQDFSKIIWRVQIWYVVQ